ESLAESRRREQEQQQADARAGLQQEEPQSRKRHGRRFYFPGPPRSRLSRQGPGTPFIRKKEPSLVTEAGWTAYPEIRPAVIGDASTLMRRVDAGTPALAKMLLSCTTSPGASV